MSIAAVLCVWAGCQTPNQKPEARTQAESQLAAAFRTDDPQLLEAALASGASTNRALILSIRDGKTRFLEMLLSKGADPNDGWGAFDFDGSLRAFKVEDDSPLVLGELSTNGGRWEVETKPGDGVVSEILRTRKAGAADWVEGLNDLDFARALLQGKIWFQYAVKLVSGKRPLMSAVDRADVGMVELLLKAGANPLLKGVSGRDCVPCSLATLGPYVGNVDAISSARRAYNNDGYSFGLGQNSFCPPMAISVGNRVVRIWGRVPEPASGVMNSVEYAEAQLAEARKLDAWPFLIAQKTNLEQIVTLLKNTK